MVGIAGVGGVLVGLGWLWSQLSSRPRPTIAHYGELDEDAPSKLHRRRKRIN
jgi:hypothetical protein